MSFLEDCREIRRQWYETAFQQTLMIHTHFNTIRNVVSGDCFDDPASTATDSVLERLLYLYVEEAFSLPEVSDELFENFDDYVCDCIHDSEHNVFTLETLDSIIVDALDREAVYPEEYENDRDCVR